MREQRDSGLADYATRLAELSHSSLALTYAAQLDRYLTELLRSGLPSLSSKLSKGLLDGPSAPLGSFATKIDMCRALDLIDTVAAGRLHVIREIRNRFAHSAVTMHFDHPSLAASIAKLKPDRDQNPYSAYADTAMELLSSLDQSLRRRGVELDGSLRAAQIVGG